MKIKPLSEKDEKQRRSMSDFKIGDFVIDGNYGDYVYIRGFENPWTYIVEPLYPEESMVLLDYSGRDEKTYTIHFTNLRKVSKAELMDFYQDARDEMKECEKLAKLAGFKLN